MTVKVKSSKAARSVRITLFKLSWEGGAGMSSGKRFFATEAEARQHPTQGRDILNKGLLPSSKEKLLEGLIREIG